MSWSSRFTAQYFGYDERGVMSVFEVFTPTDMPTATYVDRGGRNLERDLANALRTPKMITSISGPSKSGKTVLIKKVIDADSLISVSGAALRSPEMLWDRVLSWMDAPSSATSTRSHDFGVKAEGKASGTAGIIFAKGTAEVGGGAEYTHGREHAETRDRGGVEQVIKEIANSDFVVFIDDFHYMDRDVQAEVSRQIKEAAEAGVKICTASVPHRKDDVVRGNPELRGRVQAIDFEYWTKDEILEIGRLGFDAMNFDLETGALDRLAQEASGSPQLMQQICLQLCLRHDLVDRQPDPRQVNVFTSDALRGVLEQTSTTTDFTSLLEALHNGPKVRGAARNQFRFSDGTSGDVYRCILLALRQDPPAMSFSYDDIYSRTRAVCDGDAPSGSSVTQALEQIPAIAENMQPQTRIIEWSDDVLDIVDPYFLYFVRCSPKMTSLAKS